MKRIWLGLIGFVALFSLSSLAEPDQSPGLSEDILYVEAERAYLKGDSNNALQLLSKFSSLPGANGSRSKIRAHNLRGLIHFQSKNLTLALPEFEQAVQLANQSLLPTDSLLHLTRYNLGNALFQSSKTDEALENLTSVNAEALDADTRMRFFHLLGNVYSSKNSNLDGMISYLKAADLAKDLAARDTYLQKASTSSKSVFIRDPQADIDQLNKLDFSNESPAHVAVAVFLARGYMYLGQMEKAEALLRKASDKADSGHPLKAKAEELLSDLGKLTEVDSKSVGVLLPLSGKFAKFGRLCLNAIFLAQGTFEDMPVRTGREQIRLVIRDSGESIEQAQEKFEELVKEEKVVGVIGPLLSKQFSTVTRKAQEFGVPLFSLSQRVDANELGSYVFPVALSPNQQVQMIVQAAIQSKGYKKFAILAPSDSFGDAYVNLFWEAVENAGADIVGIERYEPRSTDFQEQVRKLLGLEFLEARAFEVSDLKRRQDQYGATLKVKGKLRQRLLKAFEPRGVADFDALFIPDDPATVGQIAPALAVYDIDNVPMIGINTWNTSEIVQRAGRYLQKSLFVDGFFANNQLPSTVKFVQEYMRFFQSIPGTIEVQAFDAASIVFDTLTDKSPRSRSDFRQALLDRENFLGISGEFKFTPNGVTRGAHLLTVKGNSIVEIPMRSP